jgi:dihydrofolate reductase
MVLGCRIRPAPFVGVSGGGTRPPDPDPDRGATMRTLISTAFISLDGVVEDPGGQSDYRNGGWTFRSVDFVPEAYALKGSEQLESTAMLLGRRSYEMFSPVWPTMEDFSHYKSLPKYVVSTTLSDEDLVSDWGPTTILRSVDDVRALKESEGGPIIIHGSVTLNHALADAGLIDRYNLLVFPLLLGAGQRLFDDTDKATQKLTLVDSEVFSNGIQKNILDVVH